MRLFTYLLAFLGLASAATADRVDDILASGKPPSGVVIEIVEADTNALDWALPMVQRISARLHQKHPDLPIAVVTHGNEQFALAESHKSGAANRIRAQARALTEAGTPVHVCGGHAKMRDVPASAFPDYISVSSSGPAQITAYRNRGYELIVLRGK